MLTAGIDPIGRKLCGPPPKPQCLHDPATRQWRHMPGGIADQHHATHMCTPKRRARRDEPAPPSYDAPLG
jgi:hypothetical protein